LLPLAFLQPHVGILVYYWLSLMNPHRIAWGFASEFPFAMVIAIATLSGWLLGRERKSYPMNGLAILLALLLVWMSITTLTALSPALAYVKWSLAAKILVMSLVTIPLMQNRTRLHALVWVAAASIGYYGVKGGGFAIVTAGAYRVSGPPDSFIGDNNALALALVMVLPLMWYLWSQSRLRAIRYGLLAAMGLTTLAAITTYSRGGLIALLAIICVMLLRSRRRVALGLAVVVMAGMTAQFLPAQWYERMMTIQEYESDQSAQGRLTMWRMAINIASDRPIQGGGFSVFKDKAVYPRYNPDATTVRDVHSIYFEMLGEHGVVGLSLFLAIGILAFRQTTWIRRRSRQHDRLHWANDLAGMIQVSLVGYAVSGAFLTLGTFDLYYLLISMTVALKQTVERTLNELEAMKDAVADRAPAAIADPVRLSVGQ
jgi:probable O-glycosylation ligase (exosortase A-associated)